MIKNMTFWGYSIPEARVINYDKNDKQGVTYLLQKCPDASLCIGCGGCTATCTAGNLTDFNIRRIQMLVKRGEMKEASSDLHKCMLCGKCQLVCPRGVNTRKMIATLLEIVKNQPI